MRINTQRFIVALIAMAFVAVVLALRPQGGVQAAATESRPIAHAPLGVMPAPDTKASQGDVEDLSR